MVAAAKSKKLLATDIEIMSAIADIRAALKYGPRLPNTWGFFSNKNRQLLTLLGDVTFIQAVLLEGDPQVRDYVIAQPLRAEVEGYHFGRDLVIKFRDGSMRWYFCGRYENLVSAPNEDIKNRIQHTRQLAAEMGAEFYTRTERDFANRMTEFRNWLKLCSAMTRSRDFSAEHETAQIFLTLDTRDSVSVRSLMDMPDCDPALMLAAIARLIANGYAESDLAERTLDGNTQICRASVQSKTELRHSYVSDSGISPGRTQLIPKNRRTACVSQAWRDFEKWPCPVPDHLLSPETYRAKKRAIEMYAANRDFEAIHRECGIKEGWVRQLFKNCLAAHTDGRIKGFRALVSYGYDCRKPFRRQKPPPPSNIFRASTEGYAGTLAQLFERFPDELLKIIEANVLKLRAKLVPNIQEQKISWIDLQSEVLSFLKKHHVRDDEYPFNTKDRCYSSLSSLGRSILFKRPIRFIHSRSGKAAAALAHTGTGILSLLQATEPFQVAELDFHKHDSAAIVDILTPSGFSLVCAVPRFWIGCVVDTYTGAIIGSSDSFEAQTTESCVLDLIDSTLAPPQPSQSLRTFAGCDDGCWLPNQLISTFKYQAFDVLRLDRALAHQGTNTLSSLIATSGCAVCFSKPRAWWSRSIVERTFGELTRRGAQRLQTTYGNGPDDKRRRDPERMAITLHFTQDEMCDLAKSVIREINDTGRERAFRESSMNCLRRNAASESFLSRPLPEARHSDRPTQWVRCRQKVMGNVDKGISPSVRVKGCYFRCNELKNAWHMINQVVIVEINRNDINDARILDANNGSVIGKAYPEPKWRLHCVSWRNFVMIQRFGRYETNSNRPPDPVLDFRKEKSNEIKSAKKGGKVPRCRTTAQQVANLDRDLQREASSSVMTETGTTDKFVDRTSEVKPAGSHESPEPFSLTPAPTIQSFSRR